MRFVITLACISLFVAGCHPAAKDVAYEEFPQVQNYVVTNLELTISLLDSLSKSKDRLTAFNIFKEARLAYKKAEPFASYLNANSAQRVNGPPLPVFLEDNNRALPPVGFQSIEEQVISSEADTVLLNFQIKVTQGYLNNLADAARQTPITPQRLFVPIHQQFLRIFSLGLSGFDTPASFIGIAESAECFKALREVYRLSIKDLVVERNPELDQRFLNELQSAIGFIEDNTDFNTFDRYSFVRKHLNNLTALWVEIRHATGLWEDKGDFALNFDTPTLFEDNTFRLSNFRVSYNNAPSEKQVLLGKKLFYDKSLSSDGSLSCASCHKPELAFQDGLRYGLDKDGKPLERNTPTLVNAAFQRKFFWDGRSDNLEDQINVVFANSREFDRSGHSISLTAVDSEEYKQLFEDVFPDKQITKTQIVRALASYTSTLNSFGSRFDKNMRNESSDFTEEEILGMNLFMGKALCATCHFAPLFNGTVPPQFAEMEKEVLGVPQEPDNKQLDKDEGFYWFYKQDLHRFMFKTPTTRNVELTAPYMHNGVYNTLEEVVDFYNKGGGAGLKFDLPNQTLPFDSLSLTTDEQKAIVAFMKTLTDTTRLFQAPKEMLAGFE